MGIFLSEIRPSARKTLDYRQLNNINLRTNWLNNKTTWVRATSLVAINNDIDIRLKYILYGGTTQSKTIPSGFSELYDSNNRPLPGITSVSITNKGSMGSVREATITYSVWSIEQLNIIEKLFMTPGMSILLEWGWNVMADDDNNPVSSNLFSLVPQSDRCMTKKIIQQIDKFGGHFDGLQGQISNFSWTLNQNGGFDCTTTIVSIASMFLDMSIHSTSKQLTKPDVENTRVVESNIKATLRAITDKMNSNDKKQLIINDKIMGMRIDIDMSGYEEGNFNEIDKKEDHHYFVTWEFFEKYIVNDNLSLQMKGKDECEEEENPISNSPLSTISNSSLNPTVINNNTFGSTNNTQKNIVPKMDSNSTLLSFNGIGDSADPLTCIFPLKDVWRTTNYTDKKFFSVTHTYLPDELQLELINQQFFNLKGILLNLRTILNIINETETLNEFITNLLQKISDAAGNSWNLGVIIDEYFPDIIRVVDYNIVESDKVNPFLFKVYNINSIVKTCDLSTNVDEQIKAEIMYGSNAEDSSKSNSNTITSQYNFYGANLTNLTTQKLVPLPVNPNTNISDDITNETLEIWDEQTYKDKLQEMRHKIYYSNDGYTPETIENLKVLFKKCIADNFGRNNKINESSFLAGNVISTVNKYSVNNEQTPNNRKFQFLPLKLSLKIDGIAGLHFGNVINIDYLPERYKNKVVFQITNISHDIGTSGWETSIETIMRINTGDIETGDYDSPSFSNVNTNKTTNELSNTNQIQEPENVTVDEQKTNSNIVWILDAGHGYNSKPDYKRYPPDNVNDKSGVPQLLEYKFNRQVVDKIVKLADENNINTIKIINTDVDIKIDNRVKIINSIVQNDKTKKYILLSIHSNAQVISTVGQQGTASGVMIIVSSEKYIKNDVPTQKLFYKESKLLAPYFFNQLNDMWIKSVKLATVDKSLQICERGKISVEPVTDKKREEDLKKRLPIVNQTNCIAFLTETGFYTSPDDRKFMLSEEGQQLIAQSHINAMIEIEQYILTNNSA